MYFDEAPKTSRRDLFNYNPEFQKLESSLKEGRRLIQIRGRRRSGKTSLVLSALNENKKQPYLVLDGRSFSSSPQTRREDFLRLVESSLNEFLSRNKRFGPKIADALRSIRGIEATLGSNPPVSLQWGPRPKDAASVADILDALSREATRQKTRFIIALDEAQEFRKIMRYDLSSILAHVYDYSRGLQVIVTGSEVGMLHRFLGVDDATAPLYGRAMVEIEMLGLTEEKSREYLREGFAQAKLGASEELVQRTVSRFDGIIGWLTYCGFEAREAGRLDEKIIETTAKKASRLVATEFKNFKSVHKSNRYSIVLRSLASGANEWAVIRRALEAREGVSITQGEITKLLSNLEDSGFIAKNKIEGTYYIPDPMVREAISTRLI